MNFTALTEIAAAVVGAAQRQLPPDLRALARGVPVHYEKAPRPEVLADGFEFEGRSFKSLSAVAKEITGTAWNGFLFFGLKKPAAGAADDVS